MHVTLAVALAAVAHGPVRADDPAARTLVDKAVQAAGGPEKLARFQAATWKETGTYYGMGDGLPYTGKYAVQWPDRFRMEIEGVFTMGLDGDKGWVESQGNAQEMEKEQVAEQKANRYAGWVATLLPLQKDKSFQVAPLPEAKVDNRPAAGVKVSHAGQGDVSLYFDKQNGLLVKSEYRAKAQDLGGKEALYETFYQNYQKVEGAQVPTKFFMNRDGKRFIEAEVSEFKPADKLDAKLFAKPS
jgi:hypothetical protein